MKVLVAGATGLIGRALVLRLRDSGHTPIALSRDPERAAQSLKIGALGWDDADLSDAIASADAVVNLCGESVAAQRWDAAFKDKLARSRIEPTRRLSAASPRVLIQASAVGYYGDGGDAPLTEGSPAARDFFGTLCTAWEAEAKAGRVCYVRIGQALARGGGVLESTLRPPMLPVSPWSLGLGGPLGSGRQWVPWVHIEDVVGLFLRCLESAEMSGPYNAVAPGIITSSQFADALGRALKKPARIPVPAFALKLLVGEFTEFLLASQRVVPERTLASGYRFRFEEIGPALDDLL